MHCLTFVSIFCTIFSYSSTSDDHTFPISWITNERSFANPQQQQNDSLKPNAFVAVRIQNPAILANVQSVQSQLVSLNVNFSKYLQPIHSLHITFILIHLTDGNFGKAKAALSEAVNVIHSIHRNFQINFDGYGEFPNQTLFAAPSATDQNGHIHKQCHVCPLPQHGQHPFRPTSAHGSTTVTRLRQLFQLVKQSFERRGIKSLKEFSSYSPHMSIVNIKSDSDKSLSKYWTEFIHDKYGQEMEECPSGIEVCRMDMNRQTDNYDTLITEKFCRHY